MTTNGQKDRTCSDCQHAYIGPEGLFCMTFHEFIPDEKVAMDCVAFDAIPVNVTVLGRLPMLDVTAEEITETAAEIKALRSPPELSKLVEACDAYLQSRHCTLWGSTFEIISPRGRAEAASWLAEQIGAITDTQSVPS